MRSSRLLDRPLSRCCCSKSTRHVYVDDGISGAEFNNRPGFVRLMNAVKPRPAFQVLIMSEESRLGREAIETAYALKQLITANVRVWFPTGTV
jgi:DNA invertase Pin-like site-specific DNA recombinase